MPIFEYQCKKCEQITEVLQKADDPKPACESCGSKSTFKVMSNTSFILKGGGWYITDYARKEQKAKDKKSSSDSSEKSTNEKSTSEKTSESKESTKKEKKPTKSAS
ncbi:MAG: zinc ribbon domain-containing protein [Myxococcota bacterium]|nr:zinc ribbon domain-containing protein [Myxococcota bacterium]